MEAPATTIPATPSNFGDVAASRGAMAESTGGLYQPAANGNARSSTPSSAQSWSQPQQRPGVDPSVTGRGPNTASPEDMRDPTAPGDADNPLLEQPEEGAEPREQLYDEHGDPIDMQAYESARAEAMQRIQSRLDEGEFPFEELKSLPVTVKVNGEDRQVSLEEMRDGYMRTANYHRQLQQAHQLRDQAQYVLNLERARNGEWKDPNQLRNGLKMLGLEESFMRAAYSWAEERVAYNRLPPRERQMFDQMQAERAKNLEMQAQLRQQQMRQQQQAGPDPATIHAAKQIEQLMPRALKAAGVGMYPFAQAKFVEALQLECHDGEITPDRAMNAARSTREFLEDLAKMQGGRGPAPMRQLPAEADPPMPAVRPAFPLGPRRLAGSARPQMMLGTFGTGQVSNQQNGQPKRRSPSGFNQRFGLG